MGLGGAEHDSRSRRCPRRCVHADLSGCHVSAPRAELSDGIMPFSFFAISYVLECLPSGQRKIKISMKFTVLLPHETASEREINSV